MSWKGFCEFDGEMGKLRGSPSRDMIAMRITKPEDSRLGRSSRRFPQVHRMSPERESVRHSATFPKPR